MNGSDGLICDNGLGEATGSGGTPDNSSNLGGSGVLDLNTGGPGSVGAHSKASGGHQEDVKPSVSNCSTPLQNTSAGALNSADTDFLDGFDSKDGVVKDEGDTVDSDNLAALTDDFKDEDMKPFDDPDFSNDSNYYPMSAGGYGGPPGSHGPQGSHGPPGPPGPGGPPNMGPMNPASAPPGAVAPPTQPLPSNVLGKGGDRTLDQQYMQQSSQIFVFSTQWANRSADAVMQEQYPSIIAWHESQPDTKKHLEVYIWKYYIFFPRARRALRVYILLCCCSCSCR
jgi:hypothetical protein